MAAVKFPSEPPPVPPSRKSCPSSPATSRATLVQTDDAVVRSSGGRSNAAAEARGVPASAGRSARNAASTHRRVRHASARARRSLARATSATTLVRVPPAMRADVEREAARRILKRGDRDDLVRELVDGARALPGSRPACAETPCTDELELAAALAAVLTAPPGSDGSSTSTAALSWRHVLDRGPRRPAADLFIRRPEHRRRAARRQRRLPQRAQPRASHRDARLHVEHPRSVETAIASARAACRSSWPTGQTVSKWPSSSTCAAVAGEVGADVIAALRRRRCRSTRAAKRLEPRAEFRAAPIDGGLVGAGRFELDERLDGLAQPGRAEPHTRRRRSRRS